MVKVQPEDDKNDSDYESWDVKRILDKRENESLGGNDYLVEWENWPPGGFQWLHESRLECPLKVKEYERSLVATPKQKTSAKKSSSSSAKAKTTPRATPCRRSARINKSDVGEENNADAGEAKEERRTVEDEPSSSMKPHKKRHHRMVSTSSEDEAPQAKNAKVDASSKKRRPLRRRNSLLTKYAAKRRSAPGKMTISPAKSDEKNTHGTPSSDAGAALFGCTPERLSRPGTPEGSIINDPHKPSAKNLLPKLTSPQDRSTASKSVKKQKRLFIESDEEDAVDVETVESKEDELLVDINVENNMELNVDINLEQNMDSQQDLDINNGQDEVKEETIEFEGIFDHVNIVPMEYDLAEVKEEVQSEDNNKMETLKAMSSDSTSFTDDESVTPKDPFATDAPPPQTKMESAKKELEDILQSIANDEELNAAKATEVDSFEDHGRNSYDDFVGGRIDGSSTGAEITHATEQDAAPLPLVSYSSDDEESMDSSKTLLTANVKAVVDRLVNDVCMKESSGVPTLKELASTVSDEMKINRVPEKGIVANLNYEKVIIIGVEKNCNRVHYKIQDLNGETFVVESTEAHKNPIMNKKAVEFWENRFLFSTDA